MSTQLFYRYAVKKVDNNHLTIYMIELNTKAIPTYLFRVRLRGAFRIGTTELFNPAVLDIDDEVLPDTVLAISVVAGPVLDAVRTKPRIETYGAVYVRIGKYLVFRLFIIIT